MALAIATNTAALNAAASASSVNRDMETSMARLSTGKRINSASDDAAGVAIASRLSAEIRGTDQAIRNSLDGQALLDTAEGAHKEIENILQRMREVAVQSANDTNNDQDRANLQSEMNAMVIEIDRISGTTTWAGANLMQAAESTFSFQVGAATGEKNQIKVTIDSMGASALGLAVKPQVAPASADYTATVAAADTATEIAAKLVAAINDGTGASGSGDGTTLHGYTASNAAGVVTLTHATGQTHGAPTVTNAVTVTGTVTAISVAVDNSDITASTFTITAGSATQTGSIVVALPEKHDVATDVTTSSGSLTAITAIDTAIKNVNIQRSELGAVSNRLNHTVNNLTNISSNLSAAKGGIEDADFALETTSLAKNQILQQASTAMLAQANASKQNVLSLLQG